MWSFTSRCSTEEGEYSTHPVPMGPAPPDEPERDPDEEPELDPDEEPDPPAPLPPPEQLEEVTAMFFVELKLVASAE
jgi:hypothetical protein